MSTKNFYDWEINLYIFVLISRKVEAAPRMKKNENIFFVDWVNCRYNNRKKKHLTPTPRELSEICIEKLIRPENGCLVELSDRVRSDWKIDRIDYENGKCNSLRTFFSYFFFIFGEWAERDYATLLKQGISAFIIDIAAMIMMRWCTSRTNLSSRLKDK